LRFLLFFVNYPDPGIEKEAKEVTSIIAEAKEEIT
jgi:hypothetical protein